MTALAWWQGVDPTVPCDLESGLQFHDAERGCVYMVQPSPKGPEKVLIAGRQERGAEAHPAALPAGGGPLSDQARERS